MSAGRTGTVIQIAGDAMFVVMVLMTVFMGVLMGVFTLMDMGMAVLAAVGVTMGMRMDAGQRLPAAVRMRMIVIVAMGVAMHRAVLVNMRMFVRTLRRPALDLHFTRAATANCAHAVFSYSISISLTRISVPPIGRT
jgi:hypothetical protein